MIYLGKTKAVIFDLDGTLADSMHMWNNIDNVFIKNYGSHVPRGYKEKVKAMDFKTAASYTKKILNLSQSPEEIIAQWTRMAQDAYATRIQLKPGAGEYVRSLHEKGMPIALATASGRNLYEPLLKRCGIYDYFDIRMTTAEVGRDKRYPDIYNVCAKKLGVLPQDCVVFEDLIETVLTAKRAGMTVIGVYDEFSLGDREAIKAAADNYIESFYEAPELI